MKKTPRRQFLKSIGIGGMAALLPSWRKQSPLSQKNNVLSSVSMGDSEGQVPQYPNVVLIITDDMGYRDLGCYGAQDVPTPQLDKLADEGVRFTDAYATYPYCGPSRAGLMTGRYQQRFGFDSNLQFTKKGLPISEKTLAATLKHYGYATALVGKWHLGRLSKFHPLARGFDEFYGHLEGMRSYYTNSSLSPEDQKHRNLVDPVIDMRQEVEFEGYITDRFSEKAAEFIRRKKDRPFFVTISYNAPHSPIEKPPHKYLNRIPEGQPLKRRHYAAAVNAIDEGVGRIISELKKQGVYENTMIFFTNDNGGVPWANHSSNGELTGLKDVVYEGGIRIPFIFYWGKGKVQPSAATQPVTNLDIFSTIMAAVDTTYDQSHLDGTDLLQEELAVRLEKRAIFWSVDGGQQLAVRIGKYKLVQLFDYPPELYDFSNSIIEDYHEGVRLAAEQGALTNSMLQTLREWQSTLPKPFTGEPVDQTRRSEATRKMLRIR